MPRSWRTGALAAALTAMLAAVVPCAHGIIKVDLPVSRLYQTSRTVAVGAVARIDADARIVEVKTTEALKGQPPATFTVHLSHDNSPLPEAGACVVILADTARRQGDAVLHLADAWLLAQRIADANPPRWRTFGPFDGARSFPGRTAALAAILREQRAGRPGIQDWISHEGFLGRVHRIGSLGGPASFLRAVDLNDDGSLDLVAGMAGRVRVLVASAAGFADATDAWGLAEARASRAAVGDVNGDGRADLLLADRLWLRRGDAFAAATGRLDLPDESRWLDAAIADVTGDGRADVVVLSADGTLTIFENPGGAAPGPKHTRTLWPGGRTAPAAVFSTEWGDDGRLHAMVVHDDSIMRYGASADAAPPADFQRLTGMPLSSYQWLGARPLKVLLATALDYDGNGRADFILVTQGGGVTLANRGFGAFLVNRFIREQFDNRSAMKLPKLPFELTAEVATTAGRRVQMPNKRQRQNLLVLRPDGELFEMDNTLSR